MQILLIGEAGVCLVITRFLIGIFVNKKCKNNNKIT
jgi:hypothetical protein